MISEVAMPLLGLSFASEGLWRMVHKLASDATVCLLYTSEDADDLHCVDLGGRRIIKKKKT